MPQLGKVQMIPETYNKSALAVTIYLSICVTHFSCGHVEGLGCRVDDLVNGLHREVERHKLADRAKTSLEYTNTEIHVAHIITSTIMTIIYNV